MNLFLMYLTSLELHLHQLSDLQKQYGDDKNLTIDRAKEFNEIILTESKRLAKLINDVIDFSELENEKQHLLKSSLNIIDLLNETY